MSKKKSTRLKARHPVVRVLKSRQMIIALSTFGVGLLVLAIPDLKPIREELLTLIITLALAAIGSYTMQETASTERQDKLQREEIRELVEDVLHDLAEEVNESKERHEEKTP
jgi:hypothetical protein